MDRYRAHSARHEAGRLAMIEMTTQFTFPGEGAIIGSVDGVEVTADTSIDMSQLAYLPGWPTYRNRLERALRLRTADPSSGTGPVPRGPENGVR